MDATDIDMAEGAVDDDNLAAGSLAADPPAGAQSQPLPPPPLPAGAIQRLRAWSLPQPFADAVVHGVLNVISLRTCRAPLEVGTLLSSGRPMQLEADGVRWIILHATATEATAAHPLRAALNLAWEESGCAYPTGARHKKLLALLRVDAFGHKEHPLYADNALAAGPFCVRVAEVSKLEAPIACPGATGLWGFEVALIYIVILYSCAIRCLLI